jgi:signal transduction histidine kinase
MVTNEVQPPVNAREVVKGQKHMGRSDVARRTSEAGMSAPGTVGAQVGERDDARDIDLTVADPVALHSRDALRVDTRHDLRHAAATILLLLATIRDGNDDPRVDTAYEGIAHCANTIASMVDDVDDTGAVVGPVQLDEIARLGSMRTSLLYTGVIECDAAPATVLATNADAARLFANLIQNSCRAAGADGTVEVQVRERGEWCELRVGDSGAGFVETNGPGGIGLSSVTAIAVRLGGEVIFGRSPLGGAMVTVHLPRMTQVNSGQAEAG